MFGSGGGVGSFAAQIAKAYGANVTAVTRTENVELMRSLGADRVIDYTKEDFVRDRIGMTSCSTWGPRGPWATCDGSCVPVERW